MTQRDPLSSLPALPIDEVLPQLVGALRDNCAVVLKAPTGAGKTTRVPPALLDQDWLDGQVVLLEPRRVAARAAAKRIAAERSVRLGAEVGYQIRFERKCSDSTRLLVVTEGILIRMLQDDPFLEDIGAVILDEFHERSLHTDLALAMVSRVQREVRPDLKLVVMSATLEPEPIARFLDDCPIVVSKGRSFPVEIQYMARAPAPQVRADALAAEGVKAAAAAAQGDILAFLPGVPEILRAQERLSGWAEDNNIALFPLYGDLPGKQQDAALKRVVVRGSSRQEAQHHTGSPGADVIYRRRVVLATNVAETSLTLEGVTIVVDTGVAKILRANPSTGLNRLELRRISAASADQRAGRAGRTEPGLCLRMWAEQAQRTLEARDTPEIRRVDLMRTALELLAWGESDLNAFSWFESPEPDALTRALSQLELIDAVDARGVTSLGQQMLSLPLHPRLARLALEGAALGYPRDAALCAALLDGRDPFSRAPGHRRVASHRSDSDLLDRVDALISFERRRGTPRDLKAGAAMAILRSRDQVLRRLPAHGPAPTLERDEALGRAILTAFPDRVAKRRRGGERRALMVGGRGVELSPQSAVLDRELFVCVEVHAGARGQRDAEVRIASAILPEWLPKARCTSEADVRFDSKQERVISSLRTRYLDLTLKEAPSTNVDPEACAEALEQAARENVQRALNINAPDTQNLLLRVQFLRALMPELGLPAFTNDDWKAMLPALCQGQRSFEALRRLSVTDLIQGALSYQQWSALNTDAPTRVQVPSGSMIALQYRPDGLAPVLAVRIQEMFGLPDTPRVARGRVPVLLHLLAPNMRPQQVTDDLASFWANTYPEVRKELRQRYPKHAWPVDPLSATPERRPRRRPKK